MTKKQTLILLLALTASIGFAQQKKIAFEKYGVAEGLPEEWAIDPLQDDKGFIWFGTQNGLVKYDGYRFKVFKATSDKADTTNLQLKHFGGGLLKAKDGKIWMGENLGKGRLSSFDPLTEKFKTFYPLSKTTNRDNSSSDLLFEDEAGNIWFRIQSLLTRKWVGTYRLNPTSGVIKNYPIYNRNPRGFRSFGTLESSGTVWLLDEKKNLQRLNRQKDRFEIIIPAGKDIWPSGKADTLKQISKASANRLLLTGRHGLSIFDTKSQKIVKNYIHQPNNANSIADSVEYAVEDLKGQIWLTHRQGKISLIDPVSNQIQTFAYGTPPFPYQKGITQIQFFFVTAQNKEGILFQAWAGAGKSSFFIHYQFATKTFSLYDYNFNLPTNPLPQYSFGYKSLHDRSGLLWLGTRPGLYKQAPKKQQMDLFRYRADEPNQQFPLWKIRPL